MPWSVKHRRLVRGLVIQLVTCVVILVVVNAARRDHRQHEAAVRALNARALGRVVSARKREIGSDGSNMYFYYQVLVSFTPPGEAAVLTHINPIKPRTVRRNELLPLEYDRSYPTYAFYSGPGGDYLLPSTMSRDIELSIVCFVVCFFWELFAYVFSS